ncbi:hypothetical protein B0J14DRAFT_556051 [Halenospora varia]|nr:hypothetical protein B0J14DRAFT_556051 [Halenospora varia]
MRKGTNTLQDCILWFAASRDQEEVVRNALRNRASPDARTDRRAKVNSTALEAAAKFGHIGTIKVLIDVGVQLGSLKERPLLYATRRGRMEVEIMRLLIDGGSSVNNEPYSHGSCGVPKGVAEPFIAADKR